MDSDELTRIRDNARVAIERAQAELRESIELQHKASHEPLSIALRTASATEDTTLILRALSNKVDKLSDELENERQIRREADEKQEKSTKRLESMANKTLAVAIITLIANWGALLFAIFTHFFK